jgi:hypothetical protein
MKSNLGSLIKRGRLMCGLTVFCTVSLAALGAAPSVLANEFSVFSDCPLSNSALNGCLIAKTESGKVVLGSKTVPIEHTITLQGGFIENRETGAQEFVGAADGNTLSKTPQTVPGGLLGVVAPSFLPKFLQELVNKLVSEGLAGVTATTELAAPASSIGLNEENLLASTGTALSLPVKIKLNNTFLGSECYIGSNASPIVINLTTGTAGSFKGNRGNLISNSDGSILTITENSLVNDTFAAPKATGCGGILSLLVDPAVNAEIGLPLASGSNAAVLNNTLEQSSAEVVRERL